MTTPIPAPSRSARKTRTDPPALRLRRENAQLRAQLAKRAALVDHYYGADRESRSLLDRREHELADLRRRLDSAPASLRPHRA